MLPNDTQLGVLTIIEIYHFYQMPVLFACKNKTGNLYLATWIEEQETEDVWLYTPLSVDRFIKLRQRQIDLHQAFLQPEDGIVFKVHVSKFASNRDCALPIKADELDASLAPPPESYINLNLLPSIRWESLDQTQGASQQLALWLEARVTPDTLRTYIQRIQTLEARVAELIINP
ncbi:MAG: DUF6575 domain-containing protein [Caldilineaceae bacterium]